MPAAAAGVGTGVTRVTSAVRSLRPYGHSGRTSPELVRLARSSGSYGCSGRTAAPAGAAAGLVRSPGT
ncbi:hypothetical protein ACWGLB_18550 [Streptomyces sp. NPDC055893]